MPEFDYEEGYPFAKKLWGFIPDDTNILIVHGPAYGILDECPDGARVGCPVLLERINELKSLGHLKAVITGHIHHAAGREVHDGIQFVNAAICDEQYKAVNPVITIDID
jgi:Icc-related predicted phosphoesterase